MPAPEDQNELDQRIAGAVERAVREVRQELLAQKIVQRHRLTKPMYREGDARGVIRPQRSGERIAHRLRPAQRKVAVCGRAARAIGEPR